MKKYKLVLQEDIDNLEMARKYLCEMMDSVNVSHPLYQHITKPMWDVINKKNLSVYDEVWVMENNEPKKKIVFSITQEMNHFKNGVDVLYNLVDNQVGAGRGNDTGLVYDECEIFLDKQLLIENFLKRVLIESSLKRM